MKRIFLLISLILISGCTPSKPTAERRNYNCLYITEPIEVDGFLKEPAWQKAKTLKFILPVTLKPPISQTEAKLLWDKDYLYVGFKARDKDIWSYYTERDDPTCREDVLEIFVKPKSTQEPYYNFEINALGTIKDALNIDKKGIPGTRWAHWDCENLRLAIHIEGSLNNWQDKDDYWCLEIAIPFSDLPTLKGRTPQPGDKWLFHVARCNYSVYLPEGREFTSSANLSQVNFHRCQDWSYLRFVK